ncbi:MAG: carboxypeptidase-like regulatory domain-containing protein [Salinivirgaceae bacterium]|nr:carboxypeptidase-like regulatory domain-containing protein [Salinivirgaceae bacterium]
MNKTILTSLIFFFLSLSLIAQVGTLTGIVSDVNGEPLELINVSVKNYPLGTSTNSNGYFEIEAKPEIEYVIVFSSITHKIVEKKIVLKAGQQIKLNIALDSKSEQIQEIDIEDKQVRKTSLSRLDPKILTVIPETSGNFESIIKTLPGVSSNNELSSQYSVRGGNFDENLIYVNDVQIYRPFLIRSGQQEGLSFINSDMVSSVLFSAGGFDAKYGDKMSSVLDIRYKKPTKFGGAVSASLMGGAVMLEGRSKNSKFTHITGFRYKTSEYVLNSLETEGTYDPKFLDFQTYLTYALSKKFEVSLLGNIANNSFTFSPQNRKTKFGTVNDALELDMYYEGQEVDKFQTGTGAATLTFKPHDRLNLKLVGSGFVTNEQETFDILTAYAINAVSNDLGSDNLGDSIANLGAGTYLLHGRNFLYATIIAVEHKGNFYNGFQNWQWGIKAQQERIEDQLNEWKMVDSAGYSMPLDENELMMFYSARANNTIISMRYNAFLQNTNTYDIHSNELNVTIGARAAYWDYNDEFVVSPRVNIALEPDWEKDFVFRFSTGFYHQPAFYKEMRTREGILNENIKAQKSTHFVLGADYNFKAWGRPFKLVAEAYYKHLTDLVYYQVDNVRIIYSGQNDTDGYAYGLDMKINGEFVKGVDSWLSLSVMRTQEKLRQLHSDELDDEGNEIVLHPGYMPRPSDQRVNLGMFFQDYFPGNPDYKMHMQINFGTGLPFNQPSKTLRYDRLRTKAYQRVDIGFSKVLKRSNKNYPKGHYLHHVTDAWISAEAFNLFDRENTISHEWVTDYQGREYGVENSLTGFRLNVKLTVHF